MRVSIVLQQKDFFFTIILVSINEFAKFSFVYLGRSNKIV